MDGLMSFTKDIGGDGLRGFLVERKLVHVPSQLLEPELDVSEEKQRQFSHSLDASFEVRDRLQGGTRLIPYGPVHEKLEEGLGDSIISEQQ